MNILVVDDSRAMRYIIINSLNELNISNLDIDESVNGVDAFHKLVKKNYDVIFTDWNMPEMCGLKLVDKIRKGFCPQNQDSYIVMITTATHKDEVLNALSAGINNYICKPFSSEVLQQKLKKIVFKV